MVSPFAPLRLVPIVGPQGSADKTRLRSWVSEFGRSCRSPRACTQGDQRSSSKLVVRRQPVTDINRDINRLGRHQTQPHRIDREELSEGPAPGHRPGMACKGSRAIHGPLTRARGGQSRSTAAPSARLVRHHKRSGCAIPKLTVRVRSSSPAPRAFTALLRDERSSLTQPYGAPDLQGRMGRAEARRGSHTRGSSRPSFFTKSSDFT
jgi:hypothetical protein